MGLFRYIPFDLSKLCKALKKDWKEVERQQSKMGFEAFMCRRGVDLAKSNPVVGIAKPSKNEDLENSTALIRAT